MKKRKGSGTTYIVGIMAILLAFLFGIYIYHLRLVNYVKDRVDDGLTLALLGSAVINAEEYGRTGQAVIHDTVREGNTYNSASCNNSEDGYLQNTYALFRECLAANLELDAQMQSDLPVIQSPVTIEEFKIYNVYRKISEEGFLVETKIYEFTAKNNGWQVKVHSPGDKVYMPGTGRNGEGECVVEDTSVYAKISFQTDIFPYLKSFIYDYNKERSKLTIEMERGVAIPVIKH